MNIEQEMMKRLDGCGMFPDQAKAVIDMAREDECLTQMRQRWADECSGYPAGLIDVTWIAVRHVALKWIDANAPQAWFRPMFLSQAEQEAYLAQTETVQD